MSNDNKVIPFGAKVTSKVKPSDPNAAVIELLEDYLEAAKAGKIKFVAIASVDDRDIAFSTWEPNNTDVPNPQLVTASLGAVSYLHFRYNESCANGGESDDSLRPEKA